MDSDFYLILGKDCTLILLVCLQGNTEAWSHKTLRSCITIPFSGGFLRCARENVTSWGASATLHGQLINVFLLYMIVDSFPLLGGNGVDSWANFVHVLIGCSYRYRGNSLEVSCGKVVSGLSTHLEHHCIY